MNETLILTLIGDDRPGLVELVSQLIADRQGQWLESQFSRLEGKFAGILQVSVAIEQRPALEQDLRSLVQRGVRVVVEQAAPVMQVPCYPLTLRFVGLDRLNVVADISEVLNRYEVTILSLNSHCAPAPMSNENLFHADFDVRVPLSVGRNVLCEALEALTPELMIDLESAEVCAV
ncbi:MAG: ACT domain-containing protein [Halopseudomonas sp.]